MLGSYIAICSLLFFYRQSQSAYWPFHSTETAVLRVLSELLLAVDQGEVAALVLQDLSAAFDTVDHNILLRRLRSTYGFNGAVLKWFQSYLHDRSQYVRRGSSRSARIWNSLSIAVTSALSLPSFRRRLKTHLFQFSFPKN